MNIRKNNGITLVAVLLTVIVLIILTGITIGATKNNNKKTQDATKIVQLKMIEHAIIERKTKAQLTNENLPGTAFASQSDLDTEIDRLETISESEINLQDEDYTNYKTLSKSDLENLGIEKEEDTYMVNYKTGEVINITTIVTSKGELLYTY